MTDPAPGFGQRVARGVAWPGRSGSRTAGAGGLPLAAPDSAWALRVHPYQGFRARASLAVDFLYFVSFQNIIVVPINETLKVEQPS